MPGGSRKGERRGGAKPGIVRKPKLASSKASGRGGGTGKGRSLGTLNKSKFDPQLGIILNKRQTPLEKEQELEMYFLVVGKRMRMPREVMIDAMRYLEETGIEWAETVRANMKLLASVPVDDEEGRKPIERAIEFAEQRVREYILMAVDVAYKAAPFCHPRLAAIMTNSPGDQNPMNAVAALFKELDEAGKSPSYIDHDPAE